MRIFINDGKTTKIVFVKKTKKKKQPSQNWLNLKKRKEFLDERFRTETDQT